jgi:hypothetical protein
MNEIEKFATFLDFRVAESFSTHGQLEAVNRHFTSLHQTILESIKDPDLREEAIKHLKQCVLWTHKGLSK